jgi:integrase
MIEKFPDLTGIRNLNCHNLRHTFGQDLTSANQPVLIDRVAMLMGHYKENGTTNIEMTMIYMT